jgi:hypothetical protein
MQPTEGVILGKAGLKAQLFKEYGVDVDKQLNSKNKGGGRQITTDEVSQMIAKLAPS